MLDAVATVGTLTYNRGSVAGDDAGRAGRALRPYARRPGAASWCRQRQLTPCWTPISAWGPMSWTDSRVERWVGALAALGFEHSERGARCRCPLTPSMPSRRRVVARTSRGTPDSRRAALAGSRSAPPKCRSSPPRHLASMEQSLRLEQAALTAGDDTGRRRDRSRVAEGRRPRQWDLCGRRREEDRFPMSTSCSSRRSSRPASQRYVSTGSETQNPEVRPGHDRRFAKDVPVAFGGVSLDLHRTLIAGPLGQRIPIAQLLDRAARRSDRWPHYGDAISRPRISMPALTAGAADVPARLITLRDMLELEARRRFEPDLVVAQGTDVGHRCAVGPGRHAARGPTAP